jgi:hypothetical protein
MINYICYPRDKLRRDVARVARVSLTEAAKRVRNKVNDRCQNKRQ